MYIVVLVTTKDVAQAKAIAQKLVKEKLVACANILKGIESLFWWEGKIDSSQEALLILKSKKSCFKKIVKTVQSLHSYTVPEIIALPIAQGSKDYLEWINNCIGG